MQADRSSAQMYLLGQHHLLAQGQMLHPFTRRLLADAGITAGMEVLDVGCGLGDVSLIAAELVGQTGRVLGVDTNDTVLQVARERTQEAGFSHVSFQSGDIRSLPLSQPFDAIVGRLILMHLPSPAALLRQMAEHLRPGGLVAFQEFDVAGLTELASPASPL